MLSPDQARALALALPEAIEHDHHGRPSFRVGGRIFATLWDGSHMNVMLEEELIVAAVAERPEACAEFRWGERLRAVSVDLRRAERTLLEDLLADAWERRAPKRLRDETQEGPASAGPSASS